MVNSDRYQSMIYHHMVNYIKNVFVQTVQMLLYLHIQKMKILFQYYYQNFHHVYNFIYV